MVKVEATCIWATTQLYKPAAAESIRFEMSHHRQNPSGINPNAPRLKKLHKLLDLMFIPLDTSVGRNI
jgi:hypothetical protein